MNSLPPTSSNRYPGATPEEPVDVVFDMETQDPDDMFALCFIAMHPALCLRAVTITPGSRRQVGLVRRILRECEHPKVPVGSRNPDHPKDCVSAFHFKLFSDVPLEEPNGEGYQVLYEALQEWPELVLVTGAALHNPRRLFEQYPASRLRLWIGQGGFAGDNVVPEEHRLAKFAGMTHCPTFNFNGDIPGAKLMLATDNIDERLLVSKNVCHGVVYDEALHAFMEPQKHRFPGLRVLVEGMDRYLQKRRGGKKFHDPLAACVAASPDICEFREVRVSRLKGAWGSELQAGTRTHISVACDQEAFRRTLAVMDDQ